MNNNVSQLLAQVQANKQIMLESICDVVNHKSVYQDDNSGYPYGKDINTCLEYVLDLGKKLGFEVENVASEFGIIKYGVGDDYIGIVGHLDVVPEGDGWQTPPFEASFYDNRIHGRGILDNKGPIITCLYALYAIKQVNIKLNHPVWIMVGTNEETGFNDVKTLLKHKKPPLMGFTPDCKYPVVYAERGRCVFHIYAPNNEYETFNNFINKYFMSSDNHATNLSLNISDPEFGILEMRNLLLCNNKEQLGFSVTFSYPKNISVQEIEAIILSKMPASLTLKLISNYDPVFFPKDSFLCKQLQNAYETITHKDGTPVTTTGGTYAKMIPNIVPFGPSFPGQKGIAHLPNEWMDVDDIMLNAQIYALAIYNLGVNHD